MKPENVKIINIIMGKLGSMTETIYGLGDDSLVYWWNPADHTWKLWA